MSNQPEGRGGEAKERTGGVHDVVVVEQRALFETVFDGGAHVVRAGRRQHVLHHHALEQRERRLERTCECACVCLCLCQCVTNQ